MPAAADAAAIWAASRRRRSVDIRHSYRHAARDALIRHAAIIFTPRFISLRCFSPLLYCLLHAFATPYYGYYAFIIADTLSFHADTLPQIVAATMPCRATLSVAMISP